MERKFEEEFKRWYLQKWIPVNRPDYSKYDRETIWRKWNRKTLSEQWGVVEEFFDEIETETEVKMLGKVVKGHLRYFIDFRGNLILKDSRQEARKAALEKAKQLFNNQSK